MKLISRLMLCSLFISLSPATVPAEPPPDDPELSGASRLLAQSDTTKKKRRRRKRAKRRSGEYLPAEVPSGGAIRGVVLYKGSPPPPRKIQVVKDHHVCDQRAKTIPRMKVNDQQQVEEAVVFLGDIRAGKAPEPPAQKPFIDQKSCTFTPHVQVAVVDQPFEIVNSDPVAHSAHITQNRVTVYNRMQPQQNMRTQVTFEDVGLATLKCDVHDWMRAYIYVLWHPYHAVTGSDGSFRLTGVPPGEYELVVWQETLGEHTSRVTVEPDKETTVQIDLSTD